MKKLALSACCLLPALLPVPAAALNYFWQGGGANNAWSTGANWIDNAAPPSDLVNTDLVFGASAATFPSVPPLFNIHSLTWSVGASAYGFDSGPLTIGAGGFTQNAANAQAFSAAIILGADQVWTLASGAGALTFAGGVNTAGGPGGAKRALTVNAATTTGSGNVVNGNLSGGGSLAKTGAGILTLTGTASTFSGGTTINAGTLAFNNAGALGTGAVNLNGGQLSATASQTVNNKLSVAGAAAGSVSAAAGTTLTLKNLDLSGKLTVGAAGQTGIVMFSPSSSLALAGGMLNVSTGTLRAGNADGLSLYTSVADSTTVNAGATLDLNGFATTVKSLQGAGAITTGGTAATVLTLQAGSFAGGVSGAGGLSKTTAGTLTLTGSSSYTGITEVTGGLLAIGTGGSLTGAGNISVDTGGTLAISGMGSLSVGQATIGQSGVGAVTQSGGTFSTNGSSLHLGRDAGSSGTYTLASGSLSTSTVYVGNKGAGNFIQTGGTFTTNGKDLFIGYFNQTSNTYKLTGGSLTTGSTVVSFDKNTSVFTQGGASTHTTDTLTLGDWALVANGTYNLDGGTLAVGVVKRGVGTGFFNFNGGTIQARRDNATFLQGLTTANVRGGGALFDSAGFNVNVAQNLVHSTLAGDAATDGGLTKTGAGTLTLFGASTFTGPLAIYAGSVAIDTGGSLTGAGSLSVNTGATLAITGSVTLASGKMLSLYGTSIDTSSASLDGKGSLSTAGAFIGQSGLGAFTQSGGTFTTRGGRFYMGYDPGSSGAYTLTGGLLSTSTTYVGYSGMGNFSQSGGTFTANGDSLVVGYNAGADSAYKLTGGSLSTHATYVGYGANTSVFTQSGTSTHTTDTLILGYKGSADGSYNLDGGTLAVNSVAPTNGTGVFNFNGGTLQARQNEASFLQGLTTAHVRAGGAVFDSAGFNVTVAQGLVHSTLAGDAATDGGLTKNGAGTLTLLGASTYAGPTTVNGGTLAVNSGGKLTGGKVAVNAGATLAIGGTAGLSPGVKSLTVDGTAVSPASVALTGSGSLSTGVAYVGDKGTGNFTQSGTSTHTTGTLVLGYKSSANGSYSLDGGTLAVNAVMGDAGTATFNFNGGTLQARQHNNNFLQGLTTANVRGGGVLINTAGFNVTAAQSLVHSTVPGDAATDGGLTKKGAGTLTLAGANTYTGNTSVTAGLLGIGTGGTGGSLMGTGNIGVDTGGTLALGGTGSLSASGAVIGQNGLGTFTQSGGTFTTNGGPLYLGSNAGSSGSYTLASGSLVTGEAIVGVSGASSFAQSGGTFTASGSSLFVGFNSRYTLSGAGSLVTRSSLVNSGVFTQSGASTHTTAGLVVNGTYALDGGALVAAGVSQTLGTGVFNFNGGTLQAGQDNASFLQGLTTANVRGGGAVINTAGFDVSVAQNLIHSTLAGDAATDGGLTKTGAGTLTLSGANSFTGPLAINAGTLAVAAASALGAAPSITVNGAATLNLRGFSTLVKDLQGAGAITTGGTAATVLAVQAGSFAGGVSGAGGLSKTTAGTLTLIGPSSYTGPSSVTGGLLAIGTGGSLTFAGDIGVYPGATLTIDGNASVVLANGKALTLFGIGTDTAIVNLGGTGSLRTGAATIGHSGNAVFNQSGGTFSTGFSPLYLGLNPGSSGSYMLAGGSLSTGAAYVGLRGAGHFVQSGGAFTTNANSLIVGANPGADSAYTLTGGSLITPFTEISTAANNSVFTQSGASTHTTGLLFLGNGGDPSSLANGSYNLDGGTLAVNTVIRNFGTGTFNFNGGTLQARQNNASFLQLLTTANVRAGGAIIDSAGFDITVAQNLVHSTIAGDAATDGGLSKNGAGTLTLAGWNTFTGPVAINAGKLVIGPGGSGGTGGSLVGAGNIGVDTGGALAISGAASLSTGAANIGSNASGAIHQSGGTFSTNLAPLYLGINPGSSGSYTLTGGSLSTGAAFVGFGGAGSFTQSGGTFATNGNALVVGANAGADGAYTLSGGSLTTAATFVTDGASTSVFTQSGAGTHTTGLLVLGTSAAIGNSAYHLDGGTLAVKGVVSGGGSSTFNFNGGTLQARQDSASFLQGLGTAHVRGGGAIINTAGFNITVAQTLRHSTLAGDAATDGGLTKNGAGTLTLSAANSFTGPLAINAGTLAVAAESALGAATGGAVAVNGGGALLFTGSAALARSYNLGVATLGVGTGSTLTFAGGSSINGGFLAGPGTDALGDGATLNGVTTLASSRLTQAAGSMATLNTSTVRGAITQTGGTLALNNAAISASGRVSVGGTVNAIGMESLGVITVTSGGALANSGGNLYLGGGSRTTVNNGGALSAAIDTTVELNGGLLINNGAQTGVLNVNFGSVAKGAGSFGTVNVSDGGLFSPGDAPGTATAASFEFGARGRYDFELNNATAAGTTPGVGADLLKLSGTLTLSADTAANGRFTVAIISLDGGNNPAALSDFDASRSYAWVLATANSGITGFNADKFTLDTSGFQNSLRGGRFVVSQEGKHLDLNFIAAVPEPSSWALAVLGGLALFGLMRRRCRA